MKKPKKLLLTDFNQLTRTELIATGKEIVVRLNQHFKRHIGKSNSTSPYEIYESVMGLHPEQIDLFERDYWWNVIKRAMSKLRSSEDLFVIHSGHQWFVLQTQDESNHYKNILKRDIAALKGSMKKADRWVTNQKWREI